MLFKRLKTDMMGSMKIKDIMSGNEPPVSIYPIQGYVTPADDFFREILNDNEISDEFKKIIS